MKTLQILALSLALPVVCFGQTTNVIVHDTWADGNRTSNGADGSDIDSQWFGSGSSLSVPAAGDLRATIPAGSAFLTTYFAPEGSEITLVNPGDTLSVTWVFTPTTVNANNTSQAFNLALANSPSASRTSTDASPTAGIYAGYAMFMNMGQTLGNASPFALREWVLAGSGNLLGTSANWGANGTASANLANAGASGNAGYTSGTQYTFTMTLMLDTTTNGTLDIITTMTGTGLNGVGFLSDTNYDATPNSLSFDTFAIRPSGSASSAALFDTSLFQVLLITPVPEPTTLALVGLGSFGLIWRYRRNRQ